MTPRMKIPTSEQQCMLHLLDLCRADPHDPARPQALAILEGYLVRGAEARQRAEFIRAAQTRSPLDNRAALVD
jgi:hypothetical protein